LGAILALRNPDPDPYFNVETERNQLLKLYCDYVHESFKLSKFVFSSTENLNFKDVFCLV